MKHQVAAATPCLPTLHHIFTRDSQLSYHVYCAIYAFIDRPFLILIRPTSILDFFFLKKTPSFI